MCTGWAGIVTPSLVVCRAAAADAQILPAEPRRAKVRSAWAEHQREIEAEPVAATLR
jgi:hypothetical protein